MNSQWAVYAKRCTPPTINLLERLEMSTYASHDFARNGSISRDGDIFIHYKMIILIVEEKWSFTHKLVAFNPNCV